MGGARVAPILFGLVACAGFAGNPNNRLVGGHEGAPDVERVLVCPFNLVTALQPELQNGVEALGANLSSFIEGNGRKVERVGLARARNLWRMALERTAEGGGSSARAFADLLHERHAFDALVVPSILVKSAHAAWGEATWDGVHRKMEVSNLGAPNPGEWEITNRGIQMGGVMGEVPVVSVHLLVFSAEGERVFEGAGGIDFLQIMDAQEGLRIRGDLFKRPKVLRDALAIAFAPYLPRPAEY